MQYYYNTILCVWQRTQDDRFLRPFLFLCTKLQHLYVMLCKSILQKQTHCKREVIKIYFFFFNTKKNVIDINIYS